MIFPKQWISDLVTGSLREVIGSEDFCVNRCEREKCV